MGRQVELQASDGHRFTAWLAEPAGKPRGGLVVLHEAVIEAALHGRLRTPDGRALEPLPLPYAIPLDTAAAQ